MIASSHLSRHSLRTVSKSVRGSRWQRSVLWLMLLAGASDFPMTTFAASGTWGVDADGNWSTTTNWTGGTVADGVGFTANFSNIDYTATRTVTFDTNRTISNLNFDDTGATNDSTWIVAGSGILTLDVTSGRPTITASTPVKINVVLAGNDGLGRAGGSLIELAGANTYTGDTRISGNGASIRAIDGVGLPTASNLIFGQNGTFQSSGTFTRSLGTGPGQVQWESGQQGGFSAAGGPLIVRIGGNTNTLVWGSTANFSTASQLNLSAASADSLTDFQNGIDLGGAGVLINVVDNASSTSDLAMISGPISGATGTLQKNANGTLILTGTNSYGNTTFAAGTLQIGNGGTTGTLGTGTVTLSTNTTLAFNRSDALAVTNAFGAGTTTSTIAQNGTGTTTLSGNMSPYTGSVQVNRGTLVLDYTINTSKIGINGVLTIGSATLQLAGGSHQEVVGSTTINGAATISRKPGDLGTSTLLLNVITFANGGTLDLAIDNLAFTDNTNVNGILRNVTVGGQLAKNSTNAGDGAIVALSGSDYTQVARLGGTVADGATTNVQITEVGNTSGNVTLAASGTTTINTLSHGAGGAATVDIGVGNTLRLGATGSVIANSGQTLAFTNGTLTAGGADNTAGTLLFSHSADVTVNSAIADNGSGAVGVSKGGAGTLTLGTANSYTGKTLVNGGTLVIADENRLGSNPAALAADQLRINSATLRTTATFSLNDTNRGVTLGANGGTFQTDASTTLTVASSIAGVTVAGAQTASLTKTGTGTLVLTNANTYAGGTTISSGTVLANNATGSGTGSGGVTVNGGTFGGTGAITGSVTVNAGAFLAPGASIESLNIGVLAFTASTSHLIAEIDLGNTLAADLLNVTGTISLGGATLDLTLLNLPAVQTLPQTLLLVQNDGGGLTGDAVTGTFGTINLPAGYNAAVNYAFSGTDSLGRAGDGNDIAVTLTQLAQPNNEIVPEPSTWALLAIGLAALRRSRRRGMFCS